MSENKFVYLGDKTLKKVWDWVNSQRAWGGGEYGNPDAHPLALLYSDVCATVGFLDDALQKTKDLKLFWIMHDRAYQNRDTVGREILKFLRKQQKEKPQ